MLRDRLKAATSVADLHLREATALDDGHERGRAPSLEGDLDDVLARLDLLGVYGYARWGLSLVGSAAVGCGFGLLVVMVLLAVIGQTRGWPTWATGKKGQMPRVGFGVAYLWGGAGAAIVVWGVSTGSLKLALVGLPLIALGLFWHLIKRSLLP